MGFLTSTCSAVLMLAVLGAGEGVPFEGMIRGSGLRVFQPKSWRIVSFGHDSSVEQRVSGGPSRIPLPLVQGLSLLGCTVRVSGSLGVLDGRFSYVCCVVSERKTQSPLIWLKYQKTELPKPGATWFNGPFKDFARCATQQRSEAQFGVTSVSPCRCSLWGGF